MTAKADPAESGRKLRMHAARSVGDGGDAVALEELLARSQSVVRRFSNAVCGGQDDSEDAAQEALLKTYRYVRGLHDPSRSAHGLSNGTECLSARSEETCRRAAPRAFESTPRIPGRRFHPVEGSATTASHRGARAERPATSATARRLDEAAAELPRDCVPPRDGRMSTREVADVVGISEDNVKARLSRARARLRSESRPRANRPASAAWGSRRVVRVLHVWPSSVISQPRPPSFLTPSHTPTRHRALLNGWSRQPWPG